MNNRRNLKENLTISNKQRFSIRKFSIGIASVMLGTTLYFMGGVGTSIVHADSVQEQSVQTSKLDTNSAQASSDTSSAEQTSSQNQTSSAQNSQKAVSNASANTKSTDSKTQTSDQVANATTDKKSASQSDNASATNSKTQDNKKVVSDANRAKSTANDAQTKSAQQTAKSDAANSNTLVVQQTKKLTGNAKLNKLADSKAQTDTKTDSNYSVTDNYPEGLMNYLPSHFNNKQEYAFEWLRNENNNNIILTTNRTGDGVVYVYQDGKKVGTLAQNSSHTLHDTRDIWGYDYSINIGTVYNDNFAGIVQSNGYRLNIIYSSHAKDVDDVRSYYSTVSFFVPHKIRQTVTYKDSNGNVIDSLTHTQYGLTGQSYTTGLPSGSDYVRSGEYLVNTTHNGNGLISEFHNGYTCTKDYHDGISVTFTENDSEKTGTGTMDYVIYDSGKAVQWGSLAYGQSTDYTNDSGRYTIVNPYVPQTTNIVYQYKKLGNVVNIDPKGKTTTTQYTNDPNDPTKVESINVPSIPGYTTQVNGKTVSDKTIMPADPGQNTNITYSADAQSTTAKFVDDDNKEAQVGKTITLSGKTDQTINTGLKVPVNYELAKDQTIPATYTFKAKGNEPIVIHLVHATKADQNDNDLNKIVTRTINVTNPDGKTNTIKQVAHLHRSGTIDEVTQKATYTPWTTDNWAEYDTPQISGYTPSQAKVSATTVDGNTQDQTVTITYSADAQSTTAKFVDDDNKEAQVGKTITLSGKTDQTINTGLKVPVNYELAKDQTIPATYTFKAKGNEPIVIHLVHATKADQNDNDLNKIVTRTINVTNPDGKTNTIKQVAHLHRSGTIDEVTQKATYTPWTTDNWAEYDTPQISGYTPSQAKVSATTVDGNTQDQTVTITYSADAQSTTAKFVDDDNKEAQVGKTITLSGKTDQTINTGLKVPVNYELAKDQTIPATYTFKAKGNEPIVIHLVHATKADQNDNDLNKIVTRTINVTNPDGKTNTIKQVAHLHRSGTIDEVTQKATYTPWTTDNWAEYDTPQISGYTPSQAKVSATTVDGNTQDQTVTITYSADAQKATINYIDDTTGQTIKSDTLNGHTGDKIADPTDVIANYENSYALVSDDLANGASFDNDDKTDQVFNIHLKHDTETKEQTETVIRTISYVDNKGNKVNGSPDGKSTYTQTITFTRNVTIDKVTGKEIGHTDWTPENGVWDQVNSRDPHELGYDSVDISAVGSKIVTSNSKDETITVTYSKDGGTPTPTPEPNPDPNLQPQPSDPRNVPAPSTPTSHPTQSTNNKKDDENKDNNSNPKKRRNPNKPIVKTGSTRNNHPKINNNTSAKVANGKASKAAKTLPQTGENNKFGLIGLLFAALGVVFGLAGDRKRKN